MKIYFLLPLLIFINIFKVNSQNETPVMCTRLILNLPEEFIEDRDVLGFRSKIDSSLILISEVSNPYTFEKLIQKRISNIVKSGIDTSNFKRSIYDGYKSIQFYSYDPFQNQNRFTINFGSDDFLIDISVQTSVDRLKELENIVLGGNYNENLTINYDKCLGFSISLTGTNQTIFKKDANTINLIEKDQSGNTLSWVNFTRMPTSIFEGLNVDNSIDILYYKYFPENKYQKSDSTLIDNSNFLWKTYMKKHQTFEEYNLIGLIRKKEFDLLIIGGATSKEKLNQIYVIINSIKFTKN